ncbi:MAG: peptidylprolyl isomerase, partial [Sulfolobales archaeon]
MTFKEGDFLLVDYSVFVRDTNELIETTREEEAKERGIYREGEIYRPKLIIIGEGRVVKGFEEALINSEIGVDNEIVIEPLKAYGERDPDKVKIYSLRELARNNIIPEVGKVVEVGGSLGIVRSISGGRVVIDFNHPLAGKTLLVKYKIVKKIEDISEKIKQLIMRRFTKIPEDRIVIRVSEEEAKAEIDTPEEILFAEDLQIAKSVIAG